MVKKNQSNHLHNEPIAIIGMNCQFPGMDSDVEDVDAFYKMLLDGQTPIKDMPKNRWDIDQYYDADRKKADKIVSRKGGFLNHIDLFDSAFFKIFSAQAKHIDPQHRLFLEVSIRAFNHANITLASLNQSNTGVYCGISTHEYSQLNFKHNVKFNAYTPIGVANSAAVGRLCHFLNLKGPSMVVDTACSSSLSALYLATMALRTGQCDLAIAGGVHLSLSPESFISLSKANMLSAVGKCASFDSSADGFARGEGCGVVIVQRLRDALKQQHKIYAVIKSIVMNQDGAGPGGLAAPNLKSQISLHQAALAEASLVAGDIDYIETHGAGTALGDAIEFTAIQELHRGHHSKQNPLVVGAVKSNLGHTISSSGMASLIKVICSLQQEMIPPNLHYSTPNVSIEPESIPSILPTTVTPFKKQNHKKRVGQVSNLSFSGINVGVIVEEPPNVESEVSPSNGSEPMCFLVSAKSEYSLQQILLKYTQYLQVTSSSLRDICYTLINCRDHYQYRCAIIADDKAELLKKIGSKAYEFSKVVLQKGTQLVDNDLNQIYQAYLSGANIRSDETLISYHKVDLPLYCFDRKPHWHEPRRLSPFFTSRQPSMTVLNIEPIAVIGMSCRFPKSKNIDEFLSLLVNGESGMSDIPIDRWDNAQFYDPDMDAIGRLYIKQHGLIENVREFDAEFFKISPREAKLMSPQLRVFMEASYHALENANLSLDTIKGSNTGVFVGVGINEYTRVISDQGINLEALNIHFATGNALNALGGRVAYAFDFHGPIQAIDTACSSSMTAIHNAVLSLQSGDCDMAIAGGISILLTPDSNIALSRAKMLSPDSRCKTFSDDADGYARSEGCGIVVLKRLSSAIKDNDTVLAVIKGSSINGDGKSAGFTVPNGEAQEEVIRSALAKSHLLPSDIDYIEAHGTGTPVADPIEVNALTRIFGKHHSKESPLYISSVKTNIGHCESASGVAGIIKAILSLQTHTIFKHLNFKKLNPEIELQNTLIPLKTMPWDSPGKLRCAGVSSFGFIGANAHVILQEAPRMEKGGRVLPEMSLLVISAKKQASLELLLLSYQKYLSNTSDHFADICYTAATCRSHFLFRVAIQATTAKDAAAQIENKKYIIYPIQKTKEGIQQPVTLDQLQAAYQDGFHINWSGFYKSFDTKFEKVKLPLYEFVREEHWFEHKEKLKDGMLPLDWCYQVQWQYQLCNRQNRKIQGSQWLLIGDKQLALGFMSQGLNIVLEEDGYPLDKLSGIIFAQGLQGAHSTEPDSAIHFQKKRIKELLGLVKNLHKKNIELQLIVLTTDAIAELTNGRPNLRNSALVGFCKTLVLELPNYQTILIDLDIVDHYFSEVVDEINFNHGQSYEHIIAYQEGKRMVARLKQVDMSEKKRFLLGEGRYLITGGCGGLGLVTAQALLSAGARELILTSRNVDKPAIKAAIHKIQEHYPGRKIQTVRLDVTDKEKVRCLLLESHADGLLKGIIHAAGAALNAPLVAHQEEDVDYLFSAKVEGGWNLHEMSQHINLDFFVVYSSISSVFGSKGESVYSASNSCLDTLIAQRQSLGLVGTSIQWGPWGDVGIAKGRARDPVLKPWFINNEQGHAFIKRLINSKLNYVTVISPDFLKFMLDFVPKPKPLFHHCLEDSLALTSRRVSDEASSWLSSYIALSPEKRFTACQDLIKALCKTILELSASDFLDPHEGFFELGFDSLMVTELAAGLKEILAPSVRVMINIGFDHPTIHKLSKYIESELETQVSKTFTLNSAPEEDSIAIIGMSCSFPSAPDIEAFERLLEEGLNGIQEIPIERWDNRIYYDPNKDAPRKSYVNRLGLIDNIKQFDASFFGISPREAKLMEPQQRIFLECCYKVLENANYHPGSLLGSLTGVFAGVGPNEYYVNLATSGFSNGELSSYAITGNVLNLISGRVAYSFDFRGPSISINTACSSSLVAIHYACQGLKNRDIDYALAGGVNILLTPESNIILCKARALAADGQCKTFDEAADGYGRSEGCGVIFLKRTSDAIRDKDTILAVIKASAVNNDGKSAGLTVPNGKSQEQVMKKALSQTNLTASDISYVEAHGTGTPLGDPIEVHAINQVYGRGRSSSNPLYVGTVKTNIGHLESASGVAGLIKTVLGLQNKKIYKHLNFHKLNPNIELEETCIALENTDWNFNSQLKCAGVSAFGFSGTNAHIILQESPKKEEVTRPPLSKKQHILVLSAKSKIALDNLANRYKDYLQTTHTDFGDICFTAATCREHYPYRLALVAESAVMASRLLEVGQFALSYGNHNTLVKHHAQAIQSYLQGEPVDWTSYYETLEYPYLKVVLPNYVFDSSEFWLDKKDDATRDLMPYDVALNNLYETQWGLTQQSPLAIGSLPEFVVIARDPLVAKKRLGNLRYERIEQLEDLQAIENKTILFLYEQERFFDLFHCCQKMFRQLPERFILITEYAYAIQDKDKVNPHHTMAASFWKSFRNELKLEQNYLIDLDSNSTLETVLACLFSNSSREDLYAVRDSIYTPRLEKKQLPATLSQKSLYEENASYLIVGGTGGLGTALIEYLMERNTKHLILVSRSECPRETQSLIDSAKQKQVSIQHYVADASNHQEMKTIIQGIEKGAHPLKGVFHLAGKVQDGLIVNLTDEAMQNVLNAKMESALVLHQLTQHMSLDWFVLFSSSASLLGARGQANYAAANGFLDGLAQLRQALESAPLQSIGVLFTP